MYKNKKLICLLACLTLVISMTGCELTPSLKLTEAESSIIAEYAADLLLKHDKNYNGRLVEIKDPPPPSMDVVNDPEPAPAEEITDEDSEGGKTSGGTKPEYSSGTIAEALSLDGFEITYSSMEVKQIYPEETEEMVFSMQAQQGMELLVLHFNVTNTTGSDNVCNVLDKGALFRAIINGSERVNNQHTILLNDLSHYNDSIAGYGMTDAVLLFEIAEGSSAGITSLDMVVNVGSDSNTFKIL